MKVAIVGFGYWGEILFKAVADLKKYVDYLCVVDRDLRKRQKATKYKVDFFEEIGPVLGKVDTFIIATWENTHYELAKKCLLRKKHVFVEKPLAITLKEARQLVKIAKKNDVMLMVDHTFIYDQSFCLLKEKIERGEIGRLLKIDSFRFSPNIIKPFTNVVIDLFPHELSIFYSLLSKRPAKIIKVNTHRLVNRECDSAQITLNFGSVVTNSFLSWTHPVPRREMVFYGSKGILLWMKKDGDTDLISHFKYDIVRKTVLEEQVEIKNKSDTLVSSLSHFFQSILEQKEPVTSGKKVLPEIKILEKVLRRF